MARGVDDKMSFMEHLGELRVRIVRSLYALLAGSVPGLYFSQQIVDWLARPVTSLNYSLVFTSPAEALWVQMKVGLIVGVFISAPAILWQVWAFIAPGLHAHEKKYALPFAFIAGAVLTPTPDAFNQTLMAGPLVLLYEVGIVCARVFGRKAAPAPEPAPAESS